MVTSVTCVGDLGFFGGEAGELYYPVRLEAEQHVTEVAKVGRVWH